MIQLKVIQAVLGDSFINTTVRFRQSLNTKRMQKVTPRLSRFPALDVLCTMQLWALISVKQLSRRASPQNIRVGKEPDLLLSNEILP